jgi:hypothetical protein
MMIQPAQLTPEEVLSPRAPAHSSAAPIETAANAPSTIQRGLMTGLDIHYDGRDYHFREYRYEHLSDAVNYATLMRSRMHAKQDSR